MPLLDPLTVVEEGRRYVCSQIHNRCGKNMTVLACTVRKLLNLFRGLIDFPLQEAVVLTKDRGRMDRVLNAAR